MRTACLTVVYPGVEKYLGEYLEGISKQTCRDFDLIVVNDGFGPAIEGMLDNAGVKANVFEFSDTPQKNILYGLKKCHEAGYDVVICGDADDVMYEDRVQRIAEYFSNNADKNIVYNNVVNNDFDLYYRDRITASDILDFNVLGYSAMNLRGDLIPFILDRGNENAPAFDWWIASVYLLHFKSVDFLQDVKSYYRMHSNNFVGPAFDISEDRLRRSLDVKRATYSELAKYCGKNGFASEEIVFLQKVGEIDEIDAFIETESFEVYYKLVKSYFADTSKMYWWRDAVALKKCGKVVS